MSDVMIRTATVQDIPSLWQFLKESSDEEHAFSERVRTKIIADDHHVVIAVSGSQIVGYAWVQDYGAHLRMGFKTAKFHDLLVSESIRRNGVGRSLFEEIKSWSQHRKVKYLEWQASPKAVAFYERLGLTGDPCPQPDYPFFEIEFSY